MKTFYLVGLFALSLVGGAIGASLTRPLPAKAQVQVRSENQIVVPDDGLRFVNMQGRTVAVMGLQNGNSTFILLDNNGRPSVTFSASSGGTVVVRARTDGGEVEVGSLDGTKLARLTASGSGSSLEAVTNRSTVSILNTGGGSNVMLPGPNGTTALALTTTASGGTLTVYGPGNKPAITVEGNATGGIFSVRDQAGATTASVTGAGTFAALRSGRTVWQAPPAGN
jgi:hypothetical protein